MAKNTIMMDDDNNQCMKKIKRVMRTAVGIIVLFVLCMVTRLCMLPVHKNTDDPTSGERQN